MECCTDFFRGPPVYNQIHTGLNFTIHLPRFFGGFARCLHRNLGLGQWLNFKLLGIPYLVGKIKFKPFFFRVHWLSEIWRNIYP